MFSRKNDLSKLIDLIIKNTRSRLYISKMNAEDRNALYSEFKEWIELGSNQIINNGIIYCSKIKDI